MSLITILAMISLTINSINIIMHVINMILLHKNEKKLRKLENKF